MRGGARRTAKKRKDVARDHVSLRKLLQNRDIKKQNNTDQNHQRESGERKEIMKIDIKTVFAALAAAFSVLASQGERSS